MKKKRMNRKMIRIGLLVLVVMFTSIVTVFAERIIASSKVTYNNSTSGLSSTNVQGAVDELYDTCLSKQLFASYLMSLKSSDTVIRDDGTADHNMRYTGKNPNNYVTFEGEEWRILGTFNNIDDGTGKKETRVKIISSVSKLHKPWDSNSVNIWKSASLNSELQVLPYASNSMVDNAVWYLGDNGDENITAIQAYVNERGTNVATGNDPTWTGKVGLMYPSDYGFASSACKDGAKTLNLYDYIDCKETDWLFFGPGEWFLSPFYENTNYAHYTRNGDTVAVGGVFYANAVRPTVYLKSSVTCMNCSDSTAGTQSNPFQIKLL